MNEQTMPTCNEPLGHIVSVPLGVSHASELTLTAPEYRPSHAEIVQVLMETYEESKEVVIDWLQTSDFSEVK